jgi:hypothetical protein
MRHQRIIVYEAARRTDPEGAKYWGLLWLAVIALLLVSWGLSWIWREAEVVVRHPLDAPLYTTGVLGIFVAANGLLVWLALSILRRLFRIGCALILALVDLGNGLLRNARNCLSRMRK